MVKKNFQKFSRDILEMEGDLQTTKERAIKDKSQETHHYATQKHRESLEHKLSHYFVNNTDPETGTEGPLTSMETMKYYDNGERIVASCGRKQENERGQVKSTFESSYYEYDRDAQQWTVERFRCRDDAIERQDPYVCETTPSKEKYKFAYTPEYAPYKAEERTISRDNSYISGTSAYNALQEMFRSADYFGYESTQAPGDPPAAAEWTPRDNPIQKFNIIKENNDVYTTQALNANNQSIKNNKSEDFTLIGADNLRAALDGLNWNRWKFAENLARPEAFGKHIAGSSRQVR